MATIFSQSLTKPKRDIGYLPEQPPLYMDMTVLEYLKFVFCLKQLGKTFQEEQLEKIIRLVKLGFCQKPRKQENKPAGMTLKYLSQHRIPLSSFLYRPQRG